MSDKTPPHQPAAVRTIPRFRSEDLFGASSNEVVVVHQNEYYRLRRTRNGKLILNK